MNQKPGWRRRLGRSRRQPHLCEETDRGHPVAHPIAGGDSDSLRNRQADLVKPAATDKASGGRKYQYLPAYFCDWSAGHEIPEAVADPIHRGCIGGQDETPTTGPLVTGVI